MNDLSTPLVPSPVVPEGVSQGAYPPALFSKAVEVHNRGEWRQAIELWTTLLAYDPANLSAFYNRGRAHHRLGENEAAVRDFERVLARLPSSHPSNGMIWFHYAAALLLSHRDVAALAACEKALDLDPANAEIHHLYGGILGAALRRDEEAKREFGIAHELDPDRVETAIGMAMTMLRLSCGRDLEAWALFETRRAKGITDLYPEMPLWRGQRAFPIEGRSILVRSEQGFGDTLQFVRYVWPLLEAGADVLLEVPKPLMRLFRASLPEAVKLYETRPGIPPICDYQTALMTLPCAFPQVHAPDAPPPAPYLRVEPGDIPRPAGFRVGVVWHGGARPEDPDADSIDKRRSLPEAEGLRLVHELRQRCPVVSLQLDDLPPGTDFYDTAALIMGLSLVITVDTAVAHLAAALGKPVWLLDRFSPCWRWGVGLTTTHWYPTMTIYRQETPGDWEPVVQRVLRDLELMIEAT